METQSGLVTTDEVRNQEERDKEPDHCPFVSKAMFREKYDNVRICCIREDGHGKTCAVYRLTPFHKCPMFVLEVLRRKE